ncbi:MAG: hypothetical protein IJK27_01200 [Bacilli bacterium]|nr:hypothetical protein [Bacilli bacterium]
MLATMVKKYNAIFSLWLAVVIAIVYIFGSELENNLLLGIIYSLISILFISNIIALVSGVREKKNRAIKTTQNYRNY